MFAAASCFGGGFIVAAAGVALHNLWLVYLGYGVLGGIGLGIGYISPVSTLVKWFPDRPGMATGMAIMGFGGGAMIGSPLAVKLMQFYATPASVGVVETMLTMGVIYFFFMMFGVFTVRVPAPDWQPAGYDPSAQGGKLITNANVTADAAWKTRPFWLLWVILCFNVTAGIGILEQASPMIQEMFLAPKATQGIDPANTAAIAQATAPLAAIAGGFVGLLSLFNMLGRFFWSSLSDYTGRKAVYFIYLLLGALLYFLIPVAGPHGQHRFLCRPLRADPDHVRRRLCHHSRLPARSLRHDAGRRDSRPAHHVMVGGRRARAVSRQWHPRLPDRARGGGRGTLCAHHVSHVRAAAHRGDLQLFGRAGRFQISYAGHRLRARGSNLNQEKNHEYSFPGSIPAATIGGTLDLCVVVCRTAAGLGRDADDHQVAGAISLKPCRIAARLFPPCSWRAARPNGWAGTRRS